VTMQVFVRRKGTMIAATVQCDVDGIPKWSHHVSVLNHPWGQVADGRGRVRRLHRCDATGLDSGGYSLAYVARWAEDSEGGR
jgi:hypothetical protein